MFGVRDFSSLPRCYEGNENEEITFTASLSQNYTYTSCLPAERDTSCGGEGGISGHEKLPTLTGRLCGLVN